MALARRCLRLPAQSPSRPSLRRVRRNRAASNHPRRFLLRASASNGIDWSSVRTEAQFKGVLRLAQDKGFIPQQLRLLWEDFYDNYKDSVLGSQVDGHDEEFVVSVQASIAEHVFSQFQKPYIFPSHHERILEPYNYYEFGQRYVGSLIDFKNSFIGNLATWQRISDQLQQGHNVVLLANHQTEADPGVFAHMTKTSFPKIAENVIYVAGDRVVTDPLCKPFSMGRNLFCVYSRRHIDDVPEEKSAKEATNKRTIMQMSRMLNKGGLLLWIAPSGGRDRPRSDGVWAPNTFDHSSVGLMQKLLEKSKKKGHLYAMAMFSWRLMPPPVTIEDTIGERRKTNFTGVGVSVSDEINIEDALKYTDADASRDEKQTALANYARDLCEEEFLKLSDAIDHPERRSEHLHLEQPWLKTSAVTSAP